MAAYLDAIHQADLLMGDRKAADEYARPLKEGSLKLCHDAPLQSWLPYLENALDRGDFEDAAASANALYRQGSGIALTILHGIWKLPSGLYSSTARSDSEQSLNAERVGRFPTFSLQNANRVVTALCDNNPFSNQGNQFTQLLFKQTHTHQHQLESSFLLTRWNPFQK
ncbi:hypothetical protein [Paenibacillus sp. sgz500992]|uniref:hypothetical protein n=1 Tax=Paenibacillus sp. sgz500992 TaxID=3242476 RepID=UPI0036D2D63A